MAKIKIRASGRRRGRTVTDSLDLEIGEMTISVYIMYLFPIHCAFRYSFHFIDEGTVWGRHD